MADAMQFPESWKQFLHDYEFRDAVPVVRCGECIYFDPEGYGGASCAETGAMIWPNEDDYCSRGQRRDQSVDVRNMEEGNEHE